MNWDDAEKFLILSPSLPMSRRIGDALDAIFGAKSNAKGITDPWGAMISKGGRGR